MSILGEIGTKGETPAHSGRGSRPCFAAMPAVQAGIVQRREATSGVAGATSAPSPSRCTWHDQGSVGTAPGPGAPVRAPGSRGAPPGGVCPEPAQRPSHITPLSVDDTAICRLPAIGFAKRWWTVGKRSTGPPSHPTGTRRGARWSRQDLPDGSDHEIQWLPLLGLAMLQINGEVSIRWNAVHASTPSH